MGDVAVTYIWSYGFGSPTCPANLAKPLGTTARLVVAGKGELHLVLAQGSQCVDLDPVRNEPQSFTFVGGTGVYAGASGSGTLTRSLGGGVGTETWRGALLAPAIEFDLSAPVFSGTTNRRVKVKKGAKGARVTYRVTAQDDRDGAVPATCSPRSGRHFRIGSTRVTCEAIDASANSASTSFTIRVRATR